VNSSRAEWWVCLILFWGGVLFEPVYSTEPLNQPKLLYEEPKNLTGSIYAKGPEPGKLLFKFKRVATRSNSALDVMREYTTPEGHIAAREHVVYEGNQLVLFELDQLQTGAKGAAKLVRSGTAGSSSESGFLDFEYVQGSQGGAKKRHRESLKADTLVNDMVGPFLAIHWAELVKGEKVKCRYIVVSRCETVGFTFTRESESNWKGQEVLIVRMEPSSKILARLVEPLLFTIEKSPPHRVLQYVGRTTPKVEINGKWKELDAVLVFDWDGKSIQTQ
jgi:hypothetical protein